MDSGTRGSGTNLTDLVLGIGAALLGRLLAAGINLPAVLLMMGGGVFVGVAAAGFLVSRCGSAGRHRRRYCPYW